MRMTPTSTRRLTLMDSSETSVAAVWLAFRVILPGMLKVPPVWTESLLSLLPSASR